jgi:hypothetical protein
MHNFFKLIQIIRDFDLGNVFKSIAFPIVFLIVSYQELIELFSEMNLILPVKELPKAFQSPLFKINEEMQSVTVKNLRKLQSFPKSYRKQDMIDALLILN